MTHKEIIEIVKDVGQSIIDNAESIVGTEKYLSGLTIRININHSEIPTINIDRDFYPEGYIERNK